MSETYLHQLFVMFPRLMSSRNMSFFPMQDQIGHCKRTTYMLVKMKANGCHPIDVALDEQAYLTPMTPADEGTSVRDGLTMMTAFPAASAASTWSCSCNLSA